MIHQSTQERQSVEQEQYDQEKIRQARERHAQYVARNSDVESAKKIVSAHGDTIRARLAAGTLSIQRLQIVSGLDVQEVLDLIDSCCIEKSHFIESASQAIIDLAVWINELDRPPEDDAAYAVTPTFKHLQNLFAKAHKNRLLLAITGSWGIGKTKAAQYYCATHARTNKRPGAVRIQFDATDCKPVAVLEKILAALQGKRGSHRRGNIMSAIRSSLGPGDILFLEECQRMGEAMDVICSLHDECEIAIVVMGNPDLSTAVWGTRDTFGALASRANRFDFPATTPEDVDAWLAWHGIPEGLSSLERSRLAKAAVAIATRPGRNGGLRALADVMRIAQDFYPDQLLTGTLLVQLADHLKPSAQ